MRITLKELKKIHYIDKAIINSLDMSLYHLSVVIDGHEYLVVDKQGKVLKSHNKLALQEQMAPFSVRRVVLRHNSASDEMIGHPPSEADNCLEVPLGNPTPSSFTASSSSGSGDDKIH